MKKLIGIEEIKEMPRFDRVNLIHSLVGFKSPFLLGTVGKTSNLAVFSSIIHLGSNPPLIGIKFRPVGKESHTYKNILRNKLVSINAVDKDMYKKAHTTSVRLEENQSEFDFSGLTEEWKENVAVPFVKESPLKMLASLKEELTISSNNTHLLVLGIEWIELNDQYIHPDGTIELAEMGIVSLNGLYNYHQSEPIEKLDYVHAPD